MRVKTFFSDRQFRDSNSAVQLCNKHLEDAIIELGHQLIPFEFDPNPIKSQIFIPWDHLKSKQSFELLSSDIAIFCDRGVALVRSTFKAKSEKKYFIFTWTRL